MEIREYKRFLSTLGEQDLKDYLYKLDLSALTDEERLEIEHYLVDLKNKKVMTYLAIFGFLTVLLANKPEYAELAADLGITEPEIKEKGEKPFDLIYVAQWDACDECAPEDGKIYGKTTDKIPPLHEHCMCKFVKVYRVEKATVKAMDILVGKMDSGAVRAFESDGKRKLEVLAAPFGSEFRKDRLGQWLSARTDFMVSLGDRRPVLYLHGYSPRKRAVAKPSALGVATVTRIDDLGLWMETELDDSESSTLIWEAALVDRARASTGSVSYLVRPPNRKDGSPTPGEVTVWPIAELTLFDAGGGRVPVSDDAVVLPLRSLFDQCKIELPQSFEAGEDKSVSGRTIISKEFITPEDEGDTDMKPEEILALMNDALDKRDEAKVQAVKDTAALEVSVRAKIEAEMKASPKYRATFNVQKETKDGLFLTAEQEKRGRTLEDIKETHEYIWNLRHAIGGMRAIPLEETEAAEGLPFVPQDALDEIWLKRDAFSIARLAGIRVLQTDRLIFNVPREATPMTAMATIAEEGTYAANEVAFNLNPVTVVKRGSLLSATEELLEDQSLFQAWLLPAVGRAWGLGENIDLHAALITKAGVAIGTKDVPTDSEIMGAYFALPQVYRKGACWFSADATMLYMRSLLIATPRAYGDFPAFGGGEYETFMGKKFFTDANWKTLAVAVATDEFLGFANLSEALSLVERRGVKILVDPYTDSKTGVTNYIPSVRYVISAQNDDAISNLTDLAD